MIEDLCLLHPGVTYDKGYCWKCEEEKLQGVMEKLKSKNTLFPRKIEEAKQIIKNADMSMIGEYWEEKIDKEYIQKPADPITTSVMEDLKSRADVGLKKYNTTLGDNNHQSMLQHGYEEALDLAQYLKKEITTLNTVQDLVEQYSNNFELGAKIREKYARK